MTTDYTNTKAPMEIRSPATDASVVNTTSPQVRKAAMSGFLGSAWMPAAIAGANLGTVLTLPRYGLHTAPGNRYVADRRCRF